MIMLKNVFGSSGLFGANDYHRFVSTTSNRSSADDFDSIQDEVDSFDDPDDAAEWLESEGYDLSDFDL